MEKLKISFLNLIKTGEESITITDLCKHANVNRSTFYAHFNDINEMYNYMENHLIQNEGFDLNIHNIDANYLEKVLNFIKKHKNFYKIYLNLPHTDLSHFIYGLYNILDKTNYEITFKIAGTKQIFKLWLDNNCKTEVQQMLQILLKLL